MTLREQIQSDMKDAMRAHDAAKLSAIRMLWSSVKQKEVDERITLMTPSSPPSLRRQ